MEAKGEWLMNLAAEDFNELESKIMEDKSLVAQKDANHRTILHWAALKGREQLVEFLLKFGECQVDEPDDTNLTPLLLAVLKGSLPICKMLIERGANINQCNAKGQSAVKYAASKNHIEVLNYLLDQGANPNLRCDFGEQALHRVAAMGRHQCLDILLTHPKSEPTLKIDMQNCDGNTALHLACEADDAKSVMMLLKSGASPDPLNLEKRKAQDLAKPYLSKMISKFVQGEAQDEDMPVK